MKEQLLTAWAIHNGKNLLLLQHVPEEQLNISPLGKGRTIGGQLAHLHNTRITWSEHVAKSLYQKTALLPKESVLTIPVITEAFDTSSEIIGKVIENSWDNGGRLPSFKSGLIPFVSYLISHESHHRGNILLTLKQTGFKIPDKLKWGLWEW